MVLFFISCSNADCFKQFESVLMSLTLSEPHQQNLNNCIWTLSLKVSIWQNKVIVFSSTKMLLRRKWSCFGICQLRNSSPLDSIISEPPYFLHGYIIWITAFLKLFNGKSSHEKNPNLLPCPTTAVHKR